MSKSCKGLALALVKLRIDHIKNVQERRALPYQVDMRARIRGNKDFSSSNFKKPPKEGLPSEDILQEILNYQLLG
ncbi:hypothetical protein NC652_026911 [Populus alba x Populus x berolinensis]|nr:hypothetical protein NC652_026911 [Populus alba x Populus x berolinensis]